MGLKALRWDVRRVLSVLAGLWSGVLLCIGLLAAPASFAVLPAQQAGRLVGRMFAQEATLSLAVAVLVLILLRLGQKSRQEGDVTSPLSLNVMLAMGAVFCTVAGYYGVQPMMQAARAGEGVVSFGALHAISALFFAIKAVLVLGLTWRLSGARLAPNVNQPPTSSR